MSVQKINSGRVPGTEADNFIGSLGTLFYNEGIGDLRIGDGVTVGGIPLAFGSGDGSGYILPTASTSVKGGVKIDGTTITISNQVISGFSGNYNDLSNRPALFSGSYLDLTNRPTLVTSYTQLTDTPTIPTDTNQLTNGAGFITSSALTGYATELYVDTKFGNLTINQNAVSSSDSSAISFTPSVVFDSDVTVGGDLLPNSDLGGNLGSPDQQWKSLYVSGSTIFVGGVPISVTNNVLTVNGEPISARVNYDDVVGAPTDISQLSDATGLLNAASGTGKSAYQVAVDNGFVGTESQWLASLVGATGPAGTNGIDGTNGLDGAPGAKGDPGPAGADGTNGLDGQNGDSAYQVAVTNGFSGTESEWLISLVGATGPAGADGTNGIDGTNGLDGVNGATAYEVAVSNGFSGTESQWLASLVGATGATGSDGANGIDGASAYQVAIDNGFVGTESQWLASLVGPAGADGTNGLDGAPGPQGDTGPQGPKGDTGEISLANISVTTATAYNGSSLSYDNTTGVFTFTPPDLTKYALTTSIPTNVSDLTNDAGYTTFNANGTFSLPLLTVEPTNLQLGQIALADGIQWDPLTQSTSTPYLVLYTGTSWMALGGSNGGGVTIDEVYNAILEVG